MIEKYVPAAIKEYANRNSLQFLLLAAWGGTCASWLLQAFVGVLDIKVWYDLGRLTYFMMMFLNAGLLFSLGWFMYRGMRWSIIASKILVVLFVLLDLYMCWDMIGGIDNVLISALNVLGMICDCVFAYLVFAIKADVGLSRCDVDGRRFCLFGWIGGLILVQLICGMLYVARISDRNQVISDYVQAIREGGLGAYESLVEIVMEDNEGCTRETAEKSINEEILGRVQAKMRHPKKEARARLKSLICLFVGLGALCGGLGKMKGRREK